MLRVGTILRGIYRIDSYLSSGGFGNTYVATNIEFDERVAIKEFFMKGVTQREDNQTTVSVSNTDNKDSFLAQREKFKKEARRIRQLRNPHIVNVHDLFEENGTAYYVMDYVDGENLSERLKKTGRPMTESEVRIILPQILDALKSVHDAGIWHLDLKPANIMLEKGGNIKLIDFGASKQIDAQKGGATTSTAISYTNGYAPREQMEQNYDKFGPWTDIYALGATLYNLLTNKRPPLPSDIDDDETEDKHQSLPFPEGISDGMKNLVHQLMHTNRKNRPQSVGDLMPLGNLPTEPMNHANPSTDKKDEDQINNEETIVSNPKSEETIIDNSPKITPQDSVEPKPASAAEVQQAPYEYEEDETSKGKIAVIISGVFVILLLFIAGRNSCNNNATEIVDVDSVASQVTQEVMNKVVREKVVYDDGSSYDGEWKNGLYDGQGVYIWPDGQKYDGEWKNGIRIKGTYTWPEKRNGYIYKYVGEFNKDGNFDGEGTAYYIGGEVESGKWKNGSFVGGKNKNKEKSVSSDQQKQVSSESVNTKGFLKYNVQVGYFWKSDKELAMKMKQELISMGIAAQIYYDNKGPYRVVTSTFNNLSDAISHRDYIKKNYPKYRDTCYIFYFNKGKVELYLDD